MQATASDHDVYDVWVYSPQGNYESWIPEATTSKHSLCKKQSNELYINTFSWNFVFQKIKNAMTITK